MELLKKIRLKLACQKLDDSGYMENIQARVNLFRGKQEGTYDIKSGKKKHLTDGFCVTFHQNEADETGHYKSHMGRYTSQDYDLLTNQLKNKYGCAVNVGVFDGEPEVSFHVRNFADACAIMVKYNQHSIYDVKRGKIIRNFLWNETQNPMKGKSDEQILGRILDTRQALATSGYAGG